MIADHIARHYRHARHGVRNSTRRKRRISGLTPGRASSRARRRRASATYPVKQFVRSVAAGSVIWLALALLWTPGAQARAPALTFFPRAFEAPQMHAAAH